MSALEDVLDEFQQNRLTGCFLMRQFQICQGSRRLQKLLTNGEQDVPTPEYRQGLVDVALRKQQVNLNPAHLAFSVSSLALRISAPCVQWLGWNRYFGKLLRWSKRQRLHESAAQNVPVPENEWL